jgi:hypothetical protein
LGVIQVSVAVLMLRLYLSDLPSAIRQTSTHCEGSALQAA